MKKIAIVVIHSIYATLSILSILARMIKPTYPFCDFQPSLYTQFSIFVEATPPLMSIIDTRLKCTAMVCDF